MINPQKLPLEREFQIHDDPSVASDEELLSLLEQRHAPVEPGVCRVCGAKLSISASGKGRTTWACETGARTANGMDWDHYERSQKTVVTGDPLVIEMIRRYRGFVQ